MLPRGLVWTPWSEETVKQTSLVYTCSGLCDTGQTHEEPCNKAERPFITTAIISSLPQNATHLGIDASCSVPVEAS